MAGSLPAYDRSLVLFEVECPRKLKPTDLRWSCRWFSELTPDVMDSLYEAGCDDGLLCLDEAGAPFIEFDREASSLDEAVRSAIADVHKTPYRVLRVESDAAKTVQTINAELAAFSGNES